MNYKNDNKILLILDVDETLIYATEKKLDRNSDFEIFGYNIYKRPFLDEFLNAIKDDFLIAIWSSASDEYVNEIIKQIIPNDVSLEFIWGRSHCTYKRNIQTDEYGYYDSEIDNHYHYIKPLKKLKKKGYALNRILIVDDTPHKSKDNFGNAIYPNAFMGNYADKELLILSQYLKSFLNSNNVRSIEKRGWQNKYLKP